MKILVATDIFGATPELQALLAGLPALATVISPYGDQKTDFASEDVAYASFLATSGIDAYAARLVEAIAAVSPDALLGFSAGASAAWLALTNPDVQTGLAVLFYGSRIRDFAKLRPNSPTKLVFAEREQSLDVGALVEKLRGGGVDAEIVPNTGHGFMNARSCAYDPIVTQAYVKNIAEWLANLAPRRSPASTSLGSTPS